MLHAIQTGKIQSGEAKSSSFRKELEKDLGSEVIPNKAVLVAKAAAVGLKHPLHVPRPPHWGGYIVIPDLIEFWQGRPSRLHDRIQYRLLDGGWIRERLSP